MHVLWRGSVSQRTRLVSGLVLFAFAAAHFLNHALGLVSLEAMNGFDAWRTAVTRSLIGSIVLGAALLLHALGALTKFARRRTFRLPRWEWLQLVLGLSIPLLLLPHIVNTRVSFAVLGIHDTYAYELKRIWPDAMPTQTLLLLMVWVHGCVGLHFWLRLSPLYRRLTPVLLVLASLLPAAALLGVVTQGREVAGKTAEPAALRAFQQATNWPDETTNETIVDWRQDTQEAFYAVALVAILFGLGGTLQQRRRMRIPVQYVAGPLVKTAPGPTVLEISRMHRIPHVSTCGGRGRCSTCRVMVFGDPAGLSPPSEAELQTLRSVGAAANVRLACQARVRAATTVLRLVRLGKELEQPVDVQPDESSGEERELAVLFVDIRGFTSMTEKKLPYDVVYLLNNFLETIGQAVYGSGGWINDRAGDGILAVFGDPGGLAGACRKALMACAEVDRLIGLLNRRLESELAQPLRIAMGLHCGPHVHGRIGVGDAMAMSIVGPAVNVASRLEFVAKEMNVQLACSAEVALQGGLETTGLVRRSTPIRGSAQPLEVLLFESARDLLPRLRPREATSPVA
jgi:adenylate cyclase